GEVAGGGPVTAREPRRALWAAMGIAAASEGEASTALAAREVREWRRWLPPVAVFQPNGVPLSIEFTVPVAIASQSIRWVLTAERGERWSGEVAPATLPRVAQRAFDGAVLSRHRLVLPCSAATLGQGYHRFELECGDDEPATMTLIVVPWRCYEAPALEQGLRTWGPSIQLYAVRSRRNWGIGDLTDLQQIVEFAGGNGAGIVGLNPLHALSSVAPQHASPYNPSSRLFGNTLYVDVEAVPEFTQCLPALRAVSNADFQAKLKWLREGELVGYRVSFAAKREVMELLYRCFRDRHRGRGDERDVAFAPSLAPT